MIGSDFDSFRTTPLIERIKREFVLRIIDGRFMPGERLPSEPELAESMGVSRNSVREALSLLENEGFLSRRKGVGTFVTRGEPLVKGGIERLRAIADFIAERGYEPGYTIEGCRSLPCDEQTARRLEIQPGDSVMVIETIKLASGTPVASCIDTIPSLYLPEPVERDELAASVFEYLQSRHRIAIAFAECELIPTTADTELAGKLGVEIGAPLLLLEQIHYDDKGRKVFHSRSLFPASRFTFKLIRKRQ